MKEMRSARDEKDEGEAMQVVHMWCWLLMSSIPTLRGRGRGRRGQGRGTLQGHNILLINITQAQHEEEG